MSKQASSAKTEVKTEVKAPEAPKVTKIPTIKVLKTDAKFRGARDAWYAEVKKYDGKPVAEFEKACADKPPSLPKSLRPEAPSGWTSYFKRNSIIAIMDVEVKA